jgi:hypothetical protein
LPIDIKDWWRGADFSEQHQFLFIFKKSVFIITQRLKNNYV